MAYKNLINRSGQDVFVTLITRNGEDPANTGVSITIEIKAGQTMQVEYGNESNPFLNGCGVSLVIAQRGDDYDATLNTNDTLTIESSGRVTGSNTW